MAGNLYQTIVSGAKTLVAALQSSAGAGDAGKIIALDATGKIDNSMMPTGIGADTATIAASEALADGDFVNIWDDSGTVKVRKADATSAGKEACGFVLAAVESAANATVYLGGQNTHLTGLTDGSIYYLSVTAGVAVADTPPSSSGNVWQRLGRATSTTAISFIPSDPITLA